jgi:DEP domain-containing protein 5
MKYWRYRMYLLPKDDPAMKKIIENNLQRCDIYTANGNKPIASNKKYIEEFLKFVETHLNKIRRLNNKKLRVSRVC